MDLKVLRDNIDEIDIQIIDLIEKRLKVAEDVARYKIEVGKPVYDGVRERQKIEKCTSRVESDFDKRSIEALFHQIMTISRSRQYEIIAENSQETFGFVEKPEFDLTNHKVAYQGVEGSYGHQAALGYFGDEKNELYHVNTFEDVMKEVCAGRADYGVLPVENSSTGIINDVYDILGRYDNCVIGEQVVRVEHALLGLPGATLEDIKTVYSHPQGLMQCEGFLDDKNWNQISLKNTAVSAMKVFNDGDISQAAIASELAAKYYHLEVLKHKINDIDGNSTKFVIFKKDKEFYTNADAISISFELNHKSGSLYHILGFIIYNHLNMTLIESRPIPGEKWKYRFFIDFEGNLSQAPVRDALKGIEQEAENFKIMGNYLYKS